MKKLQWILTHVNIVFGGTFLVLVLINAFDPGLHFLSSGITNVFLILFALSAIVQGVLSILQSGKQRKKKHARQRPKKTEREEEAAKE